MPGNVNGIPHATSSDRIDLWPTTSRTIAQWIDENVPRNDDPRLSDARPPTTHPHEITDVDGLQAQLDGKTDTTDPRLSDARPPTTHPHEITDVDGLQAQLDALGYDSGERDITSSMPDVISGRVLVWRLGRTVHLTFDSLIVAVPDTPHWLTVSGLLPLGFRGANRSRYYQFAQQISSYAAGPIRIDAGGTVVIYNAKQDTGETRVIQGTVAFPTPSTLPTTLPGTPA